MTEGTPQKSVLQWLKAYRIPLIALMIWLIIVVIAQIYMHSNKLTFAELTQILADTLRGSWFGALIYIGIYLIRPLILFPASLLTILGGSVFGLFPGFFYVLFAGTLSALIPYSVGRWFSSEASDDNATSMLSRFAKMLREHPFQAILTMRLLYMPYDAVSILAGNLRIAPSHFFLATAIGNLAGTFSFVGLGASIEGDLTSGDVSLNVGMLAFSLLILVLSLGLSRFLNRKVSA